MKIRSSKQKPSPGGRITRRKSPLPPEVSSDDFAVVGQGGATFFVHDRRGGTIGTVTQRGKHFAVVLGKARQ